MKFSASMISTWASCGLQAKFSYVDQLPRKQSASATFGTCVHEALEQYAVDADVDKAVNRFLYTWDNPEVLGVKPDFWHRRVTYGGLKETGVQILRDYHDSAQWQNREVVASEHKFCVPFGRHHLSGIVDLLEARAGDSSQLKVVDFKTNGSQPTFDSLRLNIQFTIYVYASLQPEFWLGYDDGTDMTKNEDGSLRYPPMENGEELMKRFQGAERVPIWFHLRNNKEIQCGPREETDFLRLYRCCDEIEKAINYDVFVPNISGSTCTFCDYQDNCTAYVPEGNI